MRPFIILFSLFQLHNKTINAQNDQASSADSILKFGAGLFEQLESNYLFADDFDWTELRADFEIKTKGFTFKQALNQVPFLFDKLKGDHLLLFTPDTLYQSNLKKEITAEDLSPSLIEAYNEGMEFHTRLINEHYGYILIPKMLLLNADKEQLDSAAQFIYDATIELANSAEIKGWIIDLRLNVGGNSNVMINGLYHLLGDGTAYLFLDKDKAVATWTGLDSGIYYQNQEEYGRIIPKQEPLQNPPVVLVSGTMSASAGEFVTLAFRGRPNTQIVGMESYGLTTANDLFELPFGITIAITESYGADRRGTYSPSIMPDKTIQKADNFEALEQDENIKEAIKWIDQCISSSVK